MEREFINPPELAPPPANLYNHVVKVGKHGLHLRARCHEGWTGRRSTLGTQRRRSGKCGPTWKRQ